MRFRYARHVESSGKLVPSFRQDHRSRNEYRYGAGFPGILIIMLMKNFLAALILS